MLLLQKDRGSRPGNLPESNDGTEIGGNCLEMYFLIVIYSRGALYTKGRNVHVTGQDPIRYRCP